MGPKLFFLLTILLSFKDSIDQMHEVIAVTTKSTKTQAGNAEQILSALEELNTTTQLLSDLSKEL